MARTEGIRVLLVYANSSMDNLIPIGVSILSACLKQAGHRVELFDTTFYRTGAETGDNVRARTLQVHPTDLSQYGIRFKQTDVVEDFIRTVVAYRPDLIAVSCVEPTIGIALKLLNAVKDVSIPKVLGGIGVMFAPDQLIRKEAIDMICVGEGEGTIVDLANSIRDGKDYFHIKNLWVKRYGFVTKNEQRPLVDLNTLPYQDWSIYPAERLYKPMGGRVRVTGAFEFARGCPRMCTYCCNYGVNQFYKGRYYRRKRVDRVIAEIEHARDCYNLEYVYFYAENFLMTKEADLDRFVEAYKTIRLPFWIETEPESLTEERLAKLKNVGCEGISVGVEHGNETFRRQMLNRRISNDDLIRALRMAARSGIRISANNIIGFPTETRELIFETIHLNRELGVDNVIVNLFNPYRGTKLREVAVEQGLLAEQVDGEDYRISTPLDQPHLSKEELLGLHRTFVLYVTLPRSEWGLIRRAEKFDLEGNRVFEALSREYRQSSP